MNIPDLVRSYYATYETKDRAALEKLVSDDFTVTSPDDDHISRKTYFERCWPNSEHIKAIRIERLFCEDNEAFVLYQLEPTSGPGRRNVEFVRIRDDQIAAVEVYFG